jgi:hypothetical protein
MKVNIKIGSEKGETKMTAKFLPLTANGDTDEGRRELSCRSVEEGGSCGSLGGRSRKCLALEDRLLLPFLGRIFPLSPGLHPCPRRRVTDLHPHLQN